MDSYEMEPAQEAAQAQGAGRKYAEFSLTFTDAWEKKEVDFTFRFAKPGKMLIKQMQKTAPRDSAQAARNLLVNIIHPEEKAIFMAACEEYPGLMTSFSGAIIKAVGIGDVGN